MKLIIAGGRNYFFTDTDVSALNQIQNITEVVCGMAKGADDEGRWWANRCDIPVKCFPSDWTNHGRAAGPIRNREMAEYADAVVLFPGGSGTANMFNEAKRRSLKIFDWRGGTPLN